MGAKGKSNGREKVRGADGRYAVAPPKPKLPPTLALRKYMAAIRPPAPNLRHGASVRLSQEDLAAAASQLIETAPWLQQPRYEVAVEMLTRVLARIRVMDAVIATHPRGWVVKATSSGKLYTNPGERHYLVLLEQARRLLVDLGMTPAAAKSLGLDAASPDQVSLDAIRKRYGAAEEKR